MFPHTATPSSTVSLCDDRVLADPYPLYEALRATGPAVRLDAHGVWAVPRHRAVETVLHDPGAFGGKNAAAVTELAGPQILAGTEPVLDHERHQRLRPVLAAQLAPRAIRRLVAGVTASAQRLVDEALADGDRIEAGQLARGMVRETVLDRMGLPMETRADLPSGAAALDASGPSSAGVPQPLPEARWMTAFLEQAVTRASVAPESWMGAVFRAVDDGCLNEGEAIPLASAYLTASMDITIAGITEVLVQLAQHPAQWRLLRDQPTRTATRAFHEALRLEAPVQGSGRMVMRPVDLDGVRIEAGDQVWLLYGSAGRDEDMWGPDADVFDLLRPRPDRHFAFGGGPHLCAGVRLAELQARSVLRALAARCTHLALADEPVRSRTPLLRGWERAPLAVERGPLDATALTEPACGQGALP